ncbi:MAG: OmpA family protein [Bdellovibrionaceae bacterium]|nr:OmpA family protein [Pseudobdellovibrionaceae bacterium]
MSAKKKKHEEHENHERWLVSYADFITLLFAFFVVMYATSTKNEEKEKTFEESIRAEMKLTVVGQGGRGQSAGDSIFGDILNPFDQFPKRGGPAEVKDYLERQIRRRMNDEERKKYGIEVRYDASGARISFAAESFFPSGSPKLKKSAVDALNMVGDILAKSDMRVMVEGHTDDTPVKTAEIASNWELASLRATSVVRYLINHQAVDPARLAAISYADQRPLVPNTTAENKAKNRRIDLLVSQ